ncbi:hypothetical protein L226DRAFT_133002 [Lentinus tigrinus ALCF2SS1-7]|uniref:uncharacterized protein n=1 Tax=Lentinus tigrinus ALCF2SS1-7 TaxID=1328758 RepID=UPI001165FC4A|nr:hypothetical protein L226DRAFT_133002 [Lentinus tigrinus ALCF2SS1-7]
MHTPAYLFHPTRPPDMFAVYHPTRPPDTSPTRGHGTSLHGRPPPGSLPLLVCGAYAPSTG